MQPAHFWFLIALLLGQNFPVKQETVLPGAHLFVCRMVPLSQRLRLTVFLKLLEWQALLKLMWCLKGPACILRLPERELGQ